MIITLCYKLGGPILSIKTVGLYYKVVIFYIQFMIKWKGGLTVMLIGLTSLLYIIVTIQTLFNSINTKDALKSLFLLNITRWKNLSSNQIVFCYSMMVQYHGLGVLYHIRKSDRLAVTKLVAKLTRMSLKSPFAVCMLVSMNHL